MDSGKSIWDMVKEEEVRFDKRVLVSPDTFVMGGHGASHGRNQPESREGDQSNPDQPKLE